jgi:selenocysteine lyase/cysteine desulfurase
MPDNPPERYEAGSHNTWAIAGLEAGLDEIGLKIGSEQLFKHVNSLTTASVERLEQINSVNLIGNPDAVKKGVGVFSFNVRGKSPQDVAEELDKRFKIAVRAGLHCAPLAHRWFGTFDSGGTARVSFGLFNSKANVESFLAALKGLSK